MKRLFLAGSVASLLALLLGAGVLAYWTAVVTGAASANVGSLDASAITAHSATGTSVSLSWSSVTAPAAGTVRYYVLRNGAASGGDCGTAAAPIAATSCTDSAPASASPATHSYAVVAVWRSWTSTSGAVSQLVKGQQTITFTSAAPTNAKVGGATYTVTATGGGSGNPVTFAIDPSAASVCSISGSTVSFTAVGTCVINANQAGNASYDAAPQAQQSFAVAKGDQTITFTSAAPADAKVGGASYTVAATAASGLTVAFSSGSPSVCTSGGTNGATFTFVAVGTCVVNANQSGNANWNAAPQAQQSFSVGKGDQTIAFTSTAPSDAKVAGPTYAVTATGGGSGNPVTFAIDPSAASVCSISGSTVSFTGAGTCVINANQAGNANWNAAPQAQQSFSVAKGDQTIAFTSTAPTNATVGGTYTASATASSGLTVTFTSATSSVCTSGGTDGATFTFVASGTCTVNANQSGNANWNAAPQAQQSFTVAAAAPTPTSLTIANASGNNAGRPEKGDTVTVVFSQQMAVSSICTNWSGNTTNHSITANNAVTVTIANDAAPSANDQLTVTVASTSCGTWRFGTIDLGSTAFVTTDRTFGGSGGNASTVEYAASTNTLVVTLGGTTSGAAGTVSTQVTATYTPHSGITSAGGVGITGTASRTAVQF